MAARTTNPVDELIRVEREAADAVAAIEVEIADVPNRIAAAVDAEDEAELSRADASRSVLAHKLTRLREVARQATVARIDGQLAELQASFDDAAQRAEQYTLATRAYESAAATVRANELHPLTTRINALHAQRLRKLGEV